MNMLPVSFIRHCPISIIVFDKNNNVTSANKKLCELIGVDEQRLIGQNQEQVDALIATKSPYNTAWYTEEVDDDKFEQLQFREIVFEHHSNQLFQQKKVSISAVDKSIATVYLFQPMFDDQSTDPNALNISHAKHDILSLLTSIYGMAELLLHRDYNEYLRCRKLKMIHQQAEIMLTKLNNLFDTLEQYSKPNK